MEGITKSAKDWAAHIRYWWGAPKFDLETTLVQIMEPDPRRAADAAQLQECRETNKRLNRRLQEAERALNELLADIKNPGPRAISFGRGLLSWKVSKLEEEVERLWTENRQLALDILVFKAEQINHERS